MVWEEILMGLGLLVAQLKVELECQFLVCSLLESVVELVLIHCRPRPFFERLEMNSVLASHPQPRPRCHSCLVPVD